jgi:hypothetical protein
MLRATLIGRGITSVLCGPLTEHLYALTRGPFRRSNAAEAEVSPSAHASGAGSTTAAKVDARAASETLPNAWSTTLQGDAGAKPAPPPQWHKRGAWIDPAHIERRMFVEDPAQPSTSIKEPETEVSKSVAALIRVRSV